MAVLHGARKLAIFLAARCVRRSTSSSCMIVLSTKRVSTRKAPLRLGGGCANSFVALCKRSTTLTRDLSLPSRGLGNTIHVTIPGSRGTARLVVGGPSVFGSCRMVGKGVSSIFVTIANGGLDKNSMG